MTSITRRRKTAGVRSAFLTNQHSGTVTLKINVASDGTVTGTGQVSDNFNRTASTCGTFGPQVTSGSDGCCSPAPQVSGTKASLTFSGSHPGNAGSVWTYQFSGVLNGNEILGLFTLTITEPSVFGAGVPDSVGSAGFPVTLR